LESTFASGYARHERGDRSGTGNHRDGRIQQRAELNVEADALGATLEDYYRSRAPEYDRFYQRVERQNDLARLKAWLTDHVRGRTILEVAAGTGYWTEVAAPVCKAMTATDAVQETLAFAAERRLGSNVELLTADAYCLPQFTTPFDAGMAHFWWSHVEKQRQQAFLSQFMNCLEPDALVLMIDQTYVEGICPVVSRYDEWQNRYELRTLQNGTTYEIVKNYPTDDELRASFAQFGKDVRIMRLDHFWALSVRNRAP
jgi:ubiquinone/menaquinone biosynthesis C-methylase UbiE